MFTPRLKLLTNKFTQSYLFQKLTQPIYICVSWYCKLDSVSDFNEWWLLLFCSGWCFDVETNESFGYFRNSLHNDMGAVRVPRLWIDYSYLLCCHYIHGSCLYLHQGSCTKHWVSLRTFYWCFLYITDLLHALLWKLGFPKMQFLNLLLMFSLHYKSSPRTTPKIRFSEDEILKHFTDAFFTLQIFANDCSEN